MAVFGTFLTPVASLGTLRNGHILVTLGAKRHTLALLLTFLYFILCHNTAFLFSKVYAL
jgi:hypothetical protein